MTTYEHAMLGINGALATGIHRTHGWKIVALAGLAAIAPDWDGLPMLINMAAYEAGHRVWGHNLLSCFILAVLLGSADFHFDLSGRLANRLVRFGPFRELQPFVSVRGATTMQANDQVGQSGRVWLVWIVTAYMAALSQIPADAVVSGGQGLSDWALKPLWPFSHDRFIYPMVPWGNVGVTIIFAVGMLALVRWKQSLQSIARLTLGLVAAYLFVWGTWIQR